MALIDHQSLRGSLSLHTPPLLSLMPGLYSLWKVLYLQRGSAELSAQPGGGHGQRPGNHVGHSTGGVPAHLERDKYAGGKGTGTPAGVLCLRRRFPKDPIFTVQTRHHLKRAFECRSTARRSHPTSTSWDSACPQASRPLCPARNSG